MSDENVITMLSEEFVNDATGMKVEGVTIIVDGKLQQVLDILKIKNPNYNHYSEIIRDALLEGINQLTGKSKG